MNMNSGMTLTCLLLSGTAMLATAATAETTLRALDGSFEMKGESVTFDAENYFLKGPQGEIIVQREFVSCLGEGCPVEEIPADPGVEENVKLSSLDGSFELAGSLLEVTATDFVIQTANGAVTVQREFVVCTGGGCPTADVDRTNFSVAVTNSNGADLLASVITDFAASKDYGVTRFVGEDSVLSTILVGNEQGQEVANINIVQMDTTTAIQAALRGEVAMVLTQDEVSENQLAEITGEAVTDPSTVLNETTVGLDAISFVTNPDNRINVLSMANLKAVMTGEITNWSELGGADAPINVHVTSADGGMADQLQTRMLGEEGLSETHNIAATTQELNAAVRQDGHALGVMYRSQIVQTKPLNLVGDCDIFFDNSEFSVQTEEYPLTVRWSQYTSAASDMPDFAANIGSYLATDAGQQSVSDEGLIAQKLRVLPMKDQGGRLLTSVLASGDSRTADTVTREYLTEISNAERLSTSLRFLTGQSTLDTKAIADIKRISSIVRSDEYEGYEVLVFGFTDSVGSIGSNISLAKRRAQRVKEILISENIGVLSEATVSTYGMGPIAPVNCNDTATGRDLNRRVEIWIRPKAYF